MLVTMLGADYVGPYSSNYYSSQNPTYGPVAPSSSDINRSLSKPATNKISSNDFASWAQTALGWGRDIAVAYFNSKGGRVTTDQGNTNLPSSTTGNLLTPTNQYMPYIIGGGALLLLLGTGILISKKRKK